MADLEKVIQGVEHCKDYEETCDECPYNYEGDGGENPCLREKLFPDVLELLRKNIGEAPIRLPKNYVTMETFAWGCPSCKFEIGYKWRYCPRCGQAVKWDD